MRKAIKIIGILIFVVITLVIAINIATKITKGVIAKITREQMEESGLADKTTQAEFDRIVDARFKIIINGILRRPKVKNTHEVTWAGHAFEVGQLKTSQYKSDGTV